MPALSPMSPRRWMTLSADENIDLGTAPTMIPALFNLSPAVVLLLTTPAAADQNTASPFSSAAPAVAAKTIPPTANAPASSPNDVFIMINGRFVGSKSIVATGGALATIVPSCYVGKAPHQPWKSTNQMRNRVVVLYRAASVLKSNVSSNSTGRRTR